MSIEVSETIRITGVHPHAECYPLLSDEQTQVLADDIAEHGQRDPITVSREGDLLDGRNRLKACEIAGVEPRIEVYNGDDYGAFVRSRNVRRHQPTGSLAMSMALSMQMDGKRESGRWEYGSQRESTRSGESIAWQQRLTEAGTVLDHAPDIAGKVVNGDLALDAAYKQAVAARDHERNKLAEQDRLKAEEADARSFIEQNAPDLAAQVGPTFQTYAEALAVWEKRNREEAARIKAEKDAKAKREAADKAGRTDLYTGMAKALQVCGVYGGYKDIGKLMAEYDPAELDPPYYAKEFTSNNLIDARHFIDGLIEWQETRNA